MRRTRVALGALAVSASLALSGCGALFAAPAQSSASTHEEPEQGARSSGAKSHAPAKAGTFLQELPNGQGSVLCVWGERMGTSKGAGGLSCDWEHVIAPGGKYERNDAGAAK